MDCVGQVVGVVGQEVVATGHWVVTAVAGHWVAVAGQTVTVPVGQTVCWIGHWVVVVESGQWVTSAGHLVALTGQTVGVAGQ